MPTSPINELLQTIHAVRRRRTLLLHLRQIGWSLAIFVALFMLCVLLAILVPPEPLYFMLLLCLLATAVAILVWWYARAVRRFRVADRQLAHYIEERIPGLEQRLLTSIGALDEQTASSDSQLIASLWRDTLSHVNGADVLMATDARPTWLAAAAALVLIGLLAGTLWQSDRFYNTARRVVWPWSPATGDMAAGQDLAVFPGDILIRRGSDITISATLPRATTQAVVLHMSTGDAPWQQVSMQSSDTSRQFAYFLTGIARDTDYYVDSGRRRSLQFRIQVYDMVRVEAIDVEYHYPTHTGLQDRTEKNSGDITAPASTQVRLQVTFNRPVQNGLLRFASGPAVALRVSENRADAALVVTQNDTYVVEAVDDDGRQVENPVRYLVRVEEDGPPQIAVTMPGRDLQVMALEEVSIAVSATDDFGLSALSLTYNVGGLGEQTVDLFNPAAQQETQTFVDASTLIFLEDLKVTPGDIIAYFVSAADNNGIKGPNQAMSDIYFLEVINTDEAFRRASGGTGGMAGAGMGQPGQGGAPSALVENQKNIIAATWKLLMRQRTIAGETFDADVEVVTESQQNLAQRTQMSLSRLTERFSFSDPSYDLSVLHLREAVGHMQTAVEKLSARSLEEALGPEQAALQAVLKAQSQSKLTDIQMARNQGGGAGAGEAQRERADLRELFDMEMGRLENRYEMPRTAAGSGNVEQDDMLRRLRELAQRQERLNRAQLDAQRRKDRMTEAQMRRRLEELRREQEELSRQAQALSRRWSQQQGRQQSRSTQSALDQAVDRMRETAHNLAQGNPGGATASGQAALQNLRDQENRTLRRNATPAELAQALREKAKQLQTQESDILRGVKGIRTAQENQSGGTARQSSEDTQDSLSDIMAQKEELNDALRETEELIRATGAKTNATQPEMARRARDILLSLASESIGQQIEESKADLQTGHLDLALEKEKAIAGAIARLGSRLQGFDSLAPPSDQERLRETADTADALARELENLRRKVDDLKMQQRRTALMRERGEVPPAEGGADPGGDASQISAELDRVRQYARGLLQPWAQSERWAVDARSIQRNLTNAQIEDFMNQPALWHQLLEPVRELAAALRGQLEAKQSGDDAFSPLEQPLPPQYESLVENYYRSLSEEQKTGQ